MHACVHYCAVPHLSLFEGWLANAKNIGQSANETGMLTAATLCNSSIGDSYSDTFICLSCTQHIQTHTKYPSVGSWWHQTKHINSFRLSNFLNTVMNERPVRYLFRHYLTWRYRSAWMLTVVFTNDTLNEPCRGILWRSYISKTLLLHCKNPSVVCSLEISTYKAGQHNKRRLPSRYFHAFHRGFPNVI